MPSYEGQFLWNELATTDVDAAVAFYTDVVGWQASEWEGGNHRYVMMMRGDAPMGGIMDMPPAAREQGAPPHWGAYVGVADTDAATDKATSLGATVVLPPTDIPGVGRFSVIFDPQGASLCLFTPDCEGTPEGPPQPGQFVWGELYTTDPDAAWDFYNSMFGWTLNGAMEMGPMGTYRMFATGGEPRDIAIGPGAKGTNTVGGIMQQPPGMGGRPSWSYYVTVADLDRAVERVKAGGGQVMMGPMTAPGGDRIAGCMDGQGAMFWLHKGG